MRRLHPLKIKIWCWIILITGLGISCLNRSSQTEQILDHFIKRYEKRIKVRYRHSAQAEWQANLEGTAQGYEEAGHAQMRLRRSFNAKEQNVQLAGQNMDPAALYSNRKDYQTLKKIRQSGLVQDPLLKRQMDVLYLSFLDGQVGEAYMRDVIELESAAKEKFSNFQFVLDNDTLSVDSLYNILVVSDDTLLLERTWKTFHDLGKGMSGDIIETVKLRNKIARELGYENFYDMQLIMGEIDPDFLDQLLVDLEKDTREAYFEYMHNLDSAVQKMFERSSSNIPPWLYIRHMQEQERERVSFDLKSFFQEHDNVHIAQQYFKQLGFDVSDIVDRSYIENKRVGIGPPSAMFDMDNEGDIRVIHRMEPGWWSVLNLIHNLGHAVYEKHINKDLPFILQEPNGLVHEGVAKFFTELFEYPDWLNKSAGIPADQLLTYSSNFLEMLRENKLSSVRELILFTSFERELYRNPNQDLNKIWWDMVEQILCITVPDGYNKAAWGGAKMFIFQPCSYHNYLMGELWVTQLIYHLQREYGGSERFEPALFFNNPAIAKCLIENVFQYGNGLSWPELTKAATGAPLSSKYFVKLYAL